MRAISAVLAVFVLSGCVSLGGSAEAPERLLTLTPSSVAPAGAAANGDISTALSVTEPTTPRRLNVTRVPVQMGNASIAYLQDAFWIEKPARLFQRVLAETIRARGTRLVIGGGELETAAPTQLGGQLVTMDYDVPSASVVVRYDAVIRTSDGNVRTQRFESVVSGVSADAISVGPALNRAANDVAAQVADWVG